MKMNIGGYGWLKSFDGGTYREGGWAYMRGEVLLEGPSCAKLITRSDDPEAYSWLSANPSMDLVIFVLT